MACAGKAEETIGRGRFRLDGGYRMLTMYAELALENSKHPVIAV